MASIVLMRPSEIQTNETLKFVLESLPSKGQRILEIGCGSGEVAKRLQEFGNEVIALDNSQQAVEASKRLGVDGRWANFHNLTKLLSIRLFLHVRFITFDRSRRRSIKRTI